MTLQNTDIMYVETDIAPDSERRSIASEDSSDAPKACRMYMWNDKFDRWRRCSVTLQLPCLYVNAYDDVGEQVRTPRLVSTMFIYFQTMS